MTTEPIEEIDLENLELDEENPRLPKSVARKPKPILEYIARKTSIEELIEAIGQNNYFAGEPLVVIRSTTNKKKYTVIEGNRRLVALKLLDDPDLMPESKKIAELVKEAKFHPKKIPCVIFDDRKTIINYLGYRHITGVKQWGPLAKARYVLTIFHERTKKSKSPAERYREVAYAIGSKAYHIARLLNGYAVYEVIEDHDFYKIDGLNDETISFSLIFTAVAYDSILKFLSDDADPIVNPKALKKANIERLTRWFFEPDNKGNTKLGESRQIAKLAEILAEEKALKKLIDGATIDQAYLQTKGFVSEFDSFLAEAERGLQQAASIINLIEFVEDQRETIKRIYLQAKSFNKLASAASADE